MSNYRFKFPELYQFFGGYFYQGWSADYRWESSKPEFVSVIRHFKAVNPPATVNRVRIELEELLMLAVEEEYLGSILTELGNNFFPSAENLTYTEWLAKIVEILNESQTKARVLRELR